MGEKKLSVIIAAKDYLSGTLRTMSGSLKSWADGVGKIAAGIGLVDSLKQVGQLIRSSVAEAADAYPKLAAPFKQLQATWTELKVQAGAALLEALRPALPLLQGITDWATNFATSLPDAIDRFQISWAYVTGAFKGLPSLAERVFGSVLSTIADFARAAGPYLDALLGTDTVALSDRLSARGAALSVQGVRGQRAVAQARDARVLEIAQRTHDFGPRTAEESDAEKKARVDAEREAQRQLDQNLARQRAQRIAAGGGGNSLTGSSSTGLNAGVEAATAAQGATGILAGGGAVGEGSRTGEVSAGDRRFGLARPDFGSAFTDALEPIRAFREEARAANEILGDLAGSSIVAVTDSLASMAVQLGQTGRVVTNPVKAIKGMLGEIAKTEGKYHIKRGAAIIAEGGWPPNPAAVLAGLKEIAAGTALAAFGGAAEGGSGGAGGGRFSGGTSPGRFAQDQQAAQDSRGTLQVVFDKGYVNPGDPAFQALLAEALAKGQYRQVEFRAR